MAAQRSALTVAIKEFGDAVACRHLIAVALQGAEKTCRRELFGDCRAGRGEQPGGEMQRWRQPWQPQPERSWQAAGKVQFERQSPQ